MFYRVQAKDHIRVPPDLLELDIKQAVIKRVKKAYEGHISNDLGVVVDVGDVLEIGEGVIIPGDADVYFETTFELLTFKPELQEVVLGNVRDIADFGAFLNLGPIEGMVHVSQTMDDFVSFSKDKVLTGKDSKRVLKVGDKCRSRIIAVSFKDLANPKLGLTMRQEYLGKLEWGKEPKIERKKPKVKGKEQKE